MRTNLTRREGLGLAGSAAAALVAAQFAPRQPAPFAPTLVLFDSRLPDSVRFAEQSKYDGVRTIDIAGEEASLWRAARNGFGTTRYDRILALTSWADRTILRSVFEERGKRTKSETRLTTPVTDSPTLFLWAMS
jgi:hypothetical protein